MVNNFDLQSVPDRMRAAAIDSFGGVDELKIQTLPVPSPAPDEVLIKVDTAGVGVWDIPDRDGTLAKMRDSEPSFPYILGRDAAGTIVQTGAEVNQFQEGDKVYAFGPPDPEANLNAEYATANVKNVAPIPESLNFREAGVLPTDGVTALCGLDQALKLKPGETLLVFGASGGIGHLAVQLAKRLGAEVFAIASGQDGVSLAQDLGADGAVDGYSDNAIEQASQFASNWFDAALMTAGGETANKALTTIREGGRAVYPNGVTPEPEAPSYVDMRSYNGEASPDTFRKLNELIDAEPFTVHIDHVFPLEEIKAAHRMLDEHFLGRIALDVNGKQA